MTFQLSTSGKCCAGAVQVNVKIKKKKRKRERKRGKKITLVKSFQGKIKSAVTFSDRTRQSGFKLKEGRFRLDLRGKSFPQRAVRPWHSCPESCGCPIPGGAQGHIGWGPGQPELLPDSVLAILPTAGGLELDDI